jgi:adenylate kinase family enzyme
MRFGDASLDALAGLRHPDATNAPSVTPPGPPIKRVAVVASAAGSGKTTLGRLLAERIGAPFIELDALRHGPDWTVASVEEMRAKMAPIVAKETWVTDGTYASLGALIAARTNLIVWLDLSPWVWLPRLLKRSARRLLFREELWNGNRETLRGVFFERDGVIPHALRAYFRRRHQMAASLAPYRYVRLRTVAEVDRFLAAFPDVYLPGAVIS